MSVVLYALGAGLIGWGGYMLLAGDSFAALDIAANLVGWGVFAVGLGAVAGGLRRLTRAIEASSRPARAPRGRLPWEAPAAPGRGPQVPRPQRQPSPVAAPVEPQIRFEPQAGPPLEERARPAVSLAAVEAELAEPLIVAPEPRMAAEPAVAIRPRAPDVTLRPRFEPASPRVEVAAPEPAPEEPDPEPLPEPEAEPVVPAPEPEESQPAVAQDADDESEANLSKRERRQRRREARQREEADAFERPEVIAPQLGGGRRFFEGPRDREPRPDFSAPGPVSPPLDRAARPFPSLRGRDPEPEAAEPIVADVDRAEDVATPDLRGAEGLQADEPEAAAPGPDASGPRSSTSDDVEPEESGPEISEAEVIEPEIVEPEVSKIETARPQAPQPQAPSPSEPKVPEWLARARARRQAKADQDVVVPAPEPSVVEPEPASEPEPFAAVDEPGPGQPQPEPQDVQQDAHHDVETQPEDGPRLVREGEHRGVTYRFYDDGSVEAQSPHGARRFANVDELRATVIAARGPGYVEPDDEPEAAAGPGAEPESSRAEVDPLEAALSELEGDGAPPRRT